MSYRIDVDVEELNLNIPRSDFPLRSDVIVGFKEPMISYPEDEGGYRETIYPSSDSNTTVSFAREKGFCGVDYGEGWVMELAKLCEKYGGTIIAKEVGEDGEVAYTRVRDGVRKKVKLVEVEN